jgi:hypothetical protein
VVFIKEERKARTNWLGPSLSSGSLCRRVKEECFLRPSLFACLPLCVASLAVFTRSLGSAGLEEPAKQTERFPQLTLLTEAVSYST